MDAALHELLDELARFGQENDARETERGRRMLNITPDTGQFLAILVRATGARDILEVGTSNGYSTIWLAWAAMETGAHEQGGGLISIEANPAKVQMAEANLQRARVSSFVTIIEGDALHELEQLQAMRDVIQPAGVVRPFDLIFLDADRPSYLQYLDLLLSLLRPGGLLVTDNVVSHAHELTDFLARLKSDPVLDSVTVPVGNGEEVTLKRVVV